MDANKSIAALQFFTSALTHGAFVHLVQGKHFESMGFGKLGEKYVAHYDEEMDWVKKFIDRINDLGGTVNMELTNREVIKSTELVKDAIDYLKSDLKQQEQGVDILYKCMADLKDDPTTYDLLKAYLADEEEDLYWSREQVDMIALIGRENWLVKQM